MSPAKSPNISGFFAPQTVIFLCTETQMQNRRFPFVDRLELSKSEYPIRKFAFFITIKKGENRYANTGF